MSSHSRHHRLKKIDEFNRKLTEIEHRSKQVRGVEESNLQKEQRFEKLRQERADYRKMTGRKPREPWWYHVGDGNVGDTFFRECLYFPEDLYTPEEDSYFEEAIDYLVNEKRKRNFSSEDLPFVLDSTIEAFWEWYDDKLSLQSDKQNFPQHKHGAHDFYHDQLEDQDYYYNPTIYGPRGQQRWVWDFKMEEKAFEPYFKHQEERRAKKKKEKNNNNV